MAQFFKHSLKLFDKQAPVPILKPVREKTKNAATQLARVHVAAIVKSY